MNADPERTCGCIGCANEATAVINRDGTRRTVCNAHVNGYGVIERV